MRKLIIFSSVIFLVSCSSALKKKGDSDTFVTDSDFLKQGHTVETYEDPVEKPKGTAEQKKEALGKKEKPLTKKQKKIDQKQKPKSSTAKKDIQKEEKKEPQQPRASSGFPFKVGEEVTLAATYFGMEAGRILIGVDNFKKLEGKKQYHFYAFGKTSSIFSMFYNVQNKIESLWDPKIKKPRSLAFDVTETKQKFKARVYFDWLKKKGEYREEGWHKKKGDYQVKKKWTLEDNAQDVVSAVFYVRTLPLEVGKEYKVTVMEEDKVVTVFLKVDRKEVLRTRAGKFNSLVLKPRFSTNGKFKQVGDISVWLTDDSYRQVIRVESKIKIGTIVAKLHSIKRP